MTGSTRRRGQQSCVVALIENRSREVGLACMNLSSYEITISQFADNQTYINTLSTIYAWSPVEIIVTDACVNSALYTRIAAQIDEARI